MDGHAASSSFASAAASDEDRSSIEIAALAWFCPSDMPNRLASVLATLRLLGDADRIFVAEPCAAGPFVPPVMIALPISSSTSAESERLRFVGKGGRPLLIRPCPFVDTLRPVPPLLPSPTNPDDNEEEEEEEDVSDAAASAAALDSAPRPFTGLLGGLPSSLSSLAARKILSLPSLLSALYPSADTLREAS